MSTLIADEIFNSLYYYIIYLYIKIYIEANVTKTYRKADIKQLTKIDEEARTITKKLNIDDRVESRAMKEAFITLRDHKKILKTSLLVD